MLPDNSSLITSRGSNSTRAAASLLSRSRPSVTALNNDDGIGRHTAIEMKFDSRGERAPECKRGTLERGTPGIRDAGRCKRISCARGRLIRIDNDPRWSWRISNRILVVSSSMMIRACRVSTRFQACVRTASLQSAGGPASNHDAFISFLR